MSQCRNNRWQRKHCQGRWGSLLTQAAPIIQATYPGNLEETREDTRMTRRSYQKTKGKATMSRTEYRAALERLGLDWKTAGPALGLSRRQAFRLASGESKVPGPAAKLLRLMIRLNLRPEDVP
jgi:hypothetical protein